MNQAEIAEKRLEIVRLRNLAAWQRDDYAQSHYRQADHPVYPGQDSVCIRKASQAERFASENEAKADVLEAKLKEVESA